MSEIQHTIYDRAGTRRVQILRRLDGRFSFEEQSFSDAEWERAWLPVTANRSLPICDTFATALREAQLRIVWVADILTAG